MLQDQGWQELALLLQVPLVVLFQGQLTEENNVIIIIFRVY